MQHRFWRADQRQTCRWLGACYGDQFSTKPLACFGDGALLTNDSERADIYRSIRAHGKGTAKYDITRIGLNSRLDTMQAAVLLSKLTVFEDELEARQKLADEYTNALSDIVVRRWSTIALRAWAQYAILVDDRDAVASALKEKACQRWFTIQSPCICSQPTCRTENAESGSPL